MCSLEYETVPRQRMAPSSGDHLFNSTANYAFPGVPRNCRGQRSMSHFLQYSHSSGSISLPAKPASPPNFRAGGAPPPRRPCLRVRSPQNASSSSSSSSSSDEDSSNETASLLARNDNAGKTEKKRVVFADAKGAPLTQVRVMTEPSDVPPLWIRGLQFLEEVTRGVQADPGTEEAAWQVTFQQPASDYIMFRKRLDDGKVSLENIMIKESEDALVGTVKVKNIAFHKEVFLRCSTNDWETHEDVSCAYVPNSLATSTGASAMMVNVIYDTFSFRMPLPLRAKKVEFCVCYRCNGQEYWDNNDNRNYTIVKKMPVQLNKRSLSSDDMYGNRTLRNSANASANGVAEFGDQFREHQKNVRYADAVQAKLDTWSEFASWNHLENTHPYW